MKAPLIETARRPVRKRALPGLLAVALLALAGCGLNVSSPDLFVLKRTGAGNTLTLLVRDDGSVLCNGVKSKPLPDPLLLTARDLATSLDKDAKAKLQIAAAARSVTFYTLTLPDGKITFPDTAGAGHKELAQAELFAVQAAQQACGLSG